MEMAKMLAIGAAKTLKTLFLVAVVLFRYMMQMEKSFT
jgi:hypothetical protein